ncbi:lachrymatory-factor synthase-like [Macadamia integrifolia]|uniref:lachrymatory-factor synthase-like n=1 Tax=Macadamia integrifolia TaxID=60698 RepID=UPI001C4F5653|nr:lachrymatory-factor synthase-like [Macadamia integrifolia]
MGDEEKPQQAKPKWEGNVSAWLKGPTEEEVWPLLEDFFNFHKIFPSLATCYGVGGVSGRPGCIRYCAGSSIPSTADNSNDGDHRPVIVSWSKERLVAIDPSQQIMSYEIVDSNIGFNSYVSTIRVLPGNEEYGSAKIEWSFAVDPVEGWKLEDLISKYELGLQRMAKRIEETLAQSPHQFE